MPGKHKNRKSYANPDRRRGQRLDAKERHQIEALHTLAKWNTSRIARELRIARSTVKLCIDRGFCAPDPPNPTKNKRQRLLHEATQNADDRSLSDEQITDLEGVTRTTWPAYSPDLNPIENIWRLLKYRISKRFPTTDAEVQQCPLEEWDKIQPEDFIKYIESMPEPSQAVVNTAGGHIRW